MPLQNISLPKKIILYFGTLLCIGFFLLLGVWYNGLPQIGLSGLKQEALEKSIQSLELKGEFLRALVNRRLTEIRWDLNVLLESSRLINSMEAKKGLSLGKSNPNEKNIILQTFVDTYPERFEKLLIVETRTSRIVASSKEQDLNGLFEFPGIIQAATQPGVDELMESLVIDHTFSVAIVRAFFATDKEDLTPTHLLVAVMDPIDLIFENQLSEFEMIENKTLIFDRNRRLVASNLKSDDPDSQFKIKAEISPGFEGTLLEFSSEGEERFVRYDSLQLVGTLPWTVVSILSKNSNLLELNKAIIRISLFGLVFGAGALCLVSFFAFRLSKPFEALAQAAQEFGRGSLSTRAMVSKDDSLEALKLAKSFNQMADSIQKNQEQLEAKIYERTAELRLSKERAEEGDRLKSAFLSNMSHEIRTPLNGIMGFSEILKSPKVNDLERVKFARNIQKNCERLLNTVNDVLEMSRIESNTILVNKNEFYVFKILHEIYANQIEAFNQRNIQLFLRVEDEKASLTLISDEQKIFQILTNLVRNSFKFTHTGFVEIGFNLIKDQVEFFVKDTGIGISEDKVELIFQRFYQVNLDLTRGHEGSGLGLAISRGLAVALGGSLTVESQLGKGSTFKLLIPRV